MGMTEEKDAPQMADAFGIPEYFVTDVGRIEDAGGGCFRIFNCIKRAGELIPVFAVVIPATSLMLATKQVQDRAVAIYRDDVRGLLPVH